MVSEPSLRRKGVAATNQSRNVARRARREPRGEVAVRQLAAIAARPSRRTRNLSAAHSAVSMGSRRDRGDGA